MSVRLPSSGLGPDHGRGSPRRGSPARFRGCLRSGVFALRTQPPRNPRTRGGHPGDRRTDRGRPRRARVGSRGSSRSITARHLRWPPSSSERWRSSSSREKRVRRAAKRRCHASGDSTIRRCRRCWGLTSFYSPYCSCCRRGGGREGTPTEEHPRDAGPDDGPLRADERLLPPRRLRRPISVANVSAADRAMPCSRS